jgi:selenide,water dikinase
LAHVLRRLHNLDAATHPALMVGIDGGDDAGVYRVSDELALVQTVDFFTPIVDDPGDWGRIAAANALSDVYAMGGTPLTALQIVGWPRDALPIDMLGEVLAGAAEVLSRARCTLVGGHSIDDAEPKFGLAVTGVVHPEDVVTNAGARPGDRLVLTKPLGTGLIATAIKRAQASEGQRDAAVASMTALNAGAGAAMRRVGVHAATDVTGFGLLGHLGEIIRSSGVSAVVDAAVVPLLPGVRELADGGIVPGGTRRNLDSAARYTVFGDLPLADRLVLADAQTSGGLLLAVDAPLEAALLQALAEEGVIGVTIGAITSRDFSDGPSGRIQVEGFLPADTEEGEPGER